MNVRERILTARLLEEMAQQQEYCERLGLRNTSKYHDKMIDNNNDNLNYEEEKNEEARCVGSYD